MKIDRSKCKKILTEIPVSCKGLIQKLKTCNDKDLVNILKEINVWEYGKCELYHWIDVLDRFDDILERVAKPDSSDNHSLIYLCRKLEDKQAKHLVYYVLYFTALLMEHAYARHLYSSIEHLTNLLAASDMDIVLAVLNLLYVFSKRSNFISRLSPERRSSLKLRLNHLAESWGGKDNGFGLAACCEDKPITEFPGTATTLHYEFYMSGGTGPSSHRVIQLEKLDAYDESSTRIMEELVKTYQVPTGKQMGLLTHIRLAQAFSNYTRRLQCVQARLQAISILVYSNAGQDILQNLLYDGLIEELVDVLGVHDHRLTDIKAAALRTLTAIIHLERTPRINAIIDATGMSSYHGFFPSLFRSCVVSMIGESTEPPLPQTLSTALFSFLYHLASYESGGEALVTCGIMETLLRIVQWKSADNSQLTFVTRAVRLVDLITNMDITTFTNFNGLFCLIQRLEVEVNNCRVTLGEAKITTPVTEDSELTEDISNSTVDIQNIEVEMVESSTSSKPEEPSTSSNTSDSYKSCISDLKVKNLCIPQRAALLKSILNFLKKAINEALFAEFIRNVMDGSLPTSLKHIISNAEYYGPSLFLLATEVVTLYVFHEPSQLSSLQDRQLTDVILDALVLKEVPPTREVIASLPNILSALCLNQRGLDAFMKCRPFDRLFHVLLSPQYLPAMRRRSSDSLGDTATNLGTAMDELMRHQPTLRQDAMTAIIRLLKEVCSMGEDENVQVQNTTLVGDNTNEDKSEGLHYKDVASDEDDTNELLLRNKHSEGNEASQTKTTEGKKSLPLMEYIYNVVRFIDAILSNNASDDHCKEFVKQGGLEPLIRIPSLPNIIIQFASSRACMDVAITLKDILTLSQEGTVIVQCFNQIDKLIDQLQPLYNTTNESVLINELAASPTPTQPYHSARTTPLLHTITALESYTTLLISLCKVGQVELRTVCINKWGNKQGLNLIDKLSGLFNVIVWENAMIGLLGPPYNYTSDRADLDRLIEAIGPNPQIKSKIGKEGKRDKVPPHIRLIKPLWQSVDRLRKHLAAFMTVLCTLSCGHTRVRRTMGSKPLPSQQQVSMTKHVIKFVVQGLNWRPPNIPKIHTRVALMAMIDHIGLTGQILYSDSHQPYHLMLLEFDKQNGIQALVQSYQWSASIPRQDDTDLVVGSGEFLISWLTLMRKLIDVKSISESTHSLPSAASTHPNMFGTTQPKNLTFEPIHFLAKSHKYTFEVISKIWDDMYRYSGMKTLKNEIGLITEHVIVIFKHLLKGDLTDKISKMNKKDLDPGGGSSSSSSSAGGASNNNDNNSNATVTPSETLISRLVDMGFTRLSAIEALINSNNDITTATDHLLTRLNLSLTGESDISEEEAMMQAIAMSLAVEGEGMDEDKKEEEKKDAKKEEVKEEKEIEYVTEEELWSLYDKILAGCIKVLEDVPSAVFKIGDLLAVIMERKGDQSRTDTIARIVPLVVEGVKHVIESFNKASYTSQATNKRVAVLGAYLHCLLLISEDLMFSCGELFSEDSLFNGHFLTLLTLYTDYVNAAEQQHTATPAAAAAQHDGNSKPPGWLTPLILLFDIHEKMATMVQRRNSLPKVEHIWQYYEERHHRWTTYPATSNAVIEKAYAAGEAEVCFQNGRRHYLILFNLMTQINEENGTPRPIMRVPKDGILPTYKAEKERKEGKEEEGMEVDDKIKPVKHFSEDEASQIVTLCTKLLRSITDADCIHALMRLLLRLTKTPKLAQLFAENNGLHHMLYIKEGSSFDGFISFSTLLFRHLLEDETTLTSAIENTILGHCTGAVTDENSDTHLKGNTMEIHNIIAKMAPVATRNETIFIAACKKLLRYTPTPSLKSLTDFTDVFSALKEPFVVKTSGEKPVEVSDISPLAKMAISTLLGRLTVLQNCVDLEAATEEGTKAGDASNPETNAKLTLHGGLDDPGETTRAPKKRRKTAHAEKEKVKAPKKFLITKSVILKMLSESVKSYNGIAEFIIDQTVINKDGESVPVLSFIMDNLLAPPSKEAAQNVEDSHESAKVLLSTIAASNSIEPTKEKFVDQLKYSFTNALGTVESPMKHAKIQAMAGLLSIILDTRSQNANSLLTLDAFSSSLNTQSPPTIAKILIAKGLVSDLAQVPHKLDLSSPHMALTVNMCLKPLEVLTKLIYSSLLTEDSNPSEKTKTSESHERSTAAGRRNNDTEIIMGRFTSRSASTPSVSIVTSTTNDGIGEIVWSSEYSRGNADTLILPVSGNNTVISSSELFQEFREGLSEAFGSSFQPPSANSGSRDTPNLQAFTDNNDDDDGGGNTAGDNAEPEGEEDGNNEEDDVENDEDDDDDDDANDDDDDDEDDDDDDDDEAIMDETVGGDADVIEEDNGSEMEVDEIELDETSNLVFETNRGDAFNFDFLNDDDEQNFVTVMSSSRLNSARTHYRWSSQSPLARARQRAHGSTSSGLSASHPLLIRNNDNVTESQPTARDTTHGLPQLLESDNTTPTFLQRLLIGGTSSAQMFFGSTRNPRTRVHVFDPSTYSGLRDEIVSDLNDINNSLGLSSETMTTLPKALTRWKEEALVLDGSSLQDLVQLIKPPIMMTLQTYLEEEVTKIKEAREKELKEEAERKEALRKEKEEKEDPDKTLAEVNSTLVYDEEEEEEDDDNDGNNPISDLNLPTSPFLRMDATITLPVAGALAVAPGGAGGGGAAGPQGNTSSGDGDGNNASPSNLGTLLSTSLNMASTNGSESSVGEDQGDGGELVQQPNRMGSDSEESSLSMLSSTPPRSTSCGEFMAVSADNISSPTDSVSQAGNPAVTATSTVTQPGLLPPPPLDTATTAGTDRDLIIRPFDVSIMTTYSGATPPLPTTMSTEPPPPTSTTIPAATVVAAATTAAAGRTGSATMAAVASTSLPPTAGEGTGPGTSTVPVDDGSGINAIYIDGIPVPEGIDPSFLEALPDSIRMEVLLEQSATLARQRRVAQQQRQQQQPGTTAVATREQTSGVSPEFLAALPPHLVEEVLEQERLSNQAGSLDNVTTNFNPSDVLMSLPTAIRQTVLADLEESQLNTLNEDLVNDYERIRNAQRTRAMYTTIPSRTNRSSVGPIFASTLSPGLTLNGNLGNGGRNEAKRSALLQEEVRKVIKKNPIEHEAITCLLVLLFIDDSLRLQTSKLHRVIRNLCCNTISRTWILISLISIIQKCSSPHKKGGKHKNTEKFLNSNNSWLTLSMNTSLGCKNNVFEIGTSSKAVLNSQDAITIHPQASTVVCRRVLDLLVALGRYFPNHFLSRSIIDSGLKYEPNSQNKKVPQAELLSNGVALTDFWDYLLGLDQPKGKCSSKHRKTDDSAVFLSCPMGQLMVLLDHPIIKNNQTLIDRLLRLLSSIAHALAEQASERKDNDKKKVVELPLDSPENGIEKHHLQLVTNILTVGSCSEEGLEDGTALLLQLSKVNAKLRDMTLTLMLCGLQTVAADLQQQISQLLDELREEHRKNPHKKRKQKDQYKGKDKLSLTLQQNKAATLKKPHRDLHLPAMSNLTKKNSSQSYFLRILKVVIAVREVTIKSLQAEKEKEKKEKQQEKEKQKGETGEESEDERKQEEEEEEEEEDRTAGLGPLSEQLKVTQLWSTLGDCLTELASNNDTHAVLILQPAVEAFFYLHGLDSSYDKAFRRRNRNTSGSLDMLAESPAPLSVEAVDSVSSLSSGGGGTSLNMTDLSIDTRKFINFAEQHRVVLNQILRQSTTPLSDGPFQVLVNHTRVLDFDVKRRYFRQELEKIEESNRREDIAIRVKREHVFEESFRELHRRTPEELKSRLYVIFEGEEGQDAGGLLREWYQIIAREIFNPHYALFTTTPGDKVTYICNSFSYVNPNHLDYFKFVGRVIAKAIFDNKYLDCYFSRSFYKHILGQPVSFRDMEAEDYAFYKSMLFLLEHDLEEVGLDNLEFTMEIEEFGMTEVRDLKPGGKNIKVTNANKKEYVKLLSQMKMTGSIRSQIKAFLDGFYDIIPRHLISIFTDTELELLISGLPNIDIDDLKANTEYHKYQSTSLQITWFWRALRSFSQTERANFLQFVTGTSKVPLQGFSALEGMNGVQKFQIHRDDRSTDRLPSAHTCFNQLDLPVYETYDKLRKMLLFAISECPEGFGLA